ncbi:cupin domain-containing protein [bacterium]|nr:MAG: cupin domain-containing protein [bacterium]
MNVRQVIDLLGLEPHPKEGGYFRETYRSTTSSHPGPPFSVERSHSTAIYYLLTPDTFSAMHRLPGDEVFHFYLGDPVEMLELYPDGSAARTILGNDPRSMQLQHVVKGGVWQGSHLVEGGQWALMGCTVAPGFDYADYESGTVGLMESYPEQAAAIRRLLQEAL